MISNLPPDITPETHPDHHTVGHRFRAYNIKYEKQAPSTARATTPRATT
jgi:hypothetical protein